MARTSSLSLLGLRLVVAGLVSSATVACGEVGAGGRPDGAPGADGGAADGSADGGGSGDGGFFAEGTVDDGYAPDPDPDLLNPERGIYYWTAREGDPHSLVGEWLYLGAVCDEELIWEGGSAGTSPVLTAYAERLRSHRDGGRKVVFRARYDTPGSDGLNGCGVFQAASEALMRRHVEAVAAMLADYREVVAFVEAGYLGRWGEWNTAGFDAAAAPVLADPERRRDFLAFVIASYRAAGLGRFVGARRPIFARELAEAHPTEGEWVSLYDDCFMTNATDMGTYSNAEGDNPFNFATVTEARAFAETLSSHAPFGGETCPSEAPRWADCANMVGPRSEPATLHMSYLHGGWAPDARETWEGGGCYDEIKRRLGYRFELRSVVYPREVLPGESARVTLVIGNTGWSRSHHPRRAHLVLRPAVGEPWVVSADLPGYRSTPGNVRGEALRDWLPGEEATFAVEFVPPPGAYALELLLPDPDRPEIEAYAIALASLRDGEPLFDRARGTNPLGLLLEARP